jgi:hypothetical protein
MSATAEVFTLGASSLTARRARGERRPSFDSRPAVPPYGLTACVLTLGAVRVPICACSGLMARPGRRIPQTDRVRRVRRICPASRKHQDLGIEVAPGFLRERVVLTLNTRDRAGNDHRLETLLTSLEARHLGHALLDAIGKAQRTWPVRVRPAHEHKQDLCFDVTHSDQPRAPAVMTLRIRVAGGPERLLRCAAYGQRSSPSLDIYSWQPRIPRA